MKIHKIQWDTPGALLAVAGLAAMALSLAALTDLAQAAEYGPRLGWLLPVSLDVLAVCAWWAHRTRNDPTARRIGLAVTAVSMLGNGASHLIAWGAFDMNRVIVAACAVTPPASAALCAFLASRPEPVAGVAPVPVVEVVAPAPPAVVVSAPRPVPVKAPRPAPAPVAVSTPAPVPSDAVTAACARFNLKPDRAPEVHAVVVKARRDDVTAVQKIRDTYSVPHAVARAANDVLRREVTA